MAIPGRLGGVPGLRPAVERHSAVLLTYLSQRPKVLLPAVSVLLLLGGLALPPAYGAPLLGLLLALVGWLVFLSWPVIQPPARALRLVVLALLGYAIVSRFR